MCLKKRLDFVISHLEFSQDIDGMPSIHFRSFWHKDPFYGIRRLIENAVLGFALIPPLTSRDGFREP